MEKNMETTIMGYIATTKGSMPSFLAQFGFTCWLLAEKEGNWTMESTISLKDIVTLNPK